MIDILKDYIMKSKPYKYVIVTPSGRKKYLEILFKYILKYREYIDEYRLWVNTHNIEDIEYMESLAKSYDFVKLDFSADGLPTKGDCWAIHSFFKNCTDENTIYLRLDDDIVWMEDDFIFKMYDFRINNPQYFLVYANIINNAIMDHIRQRLGCFESCQILQRHLFSYDCMDEIGWKNPTVAYLKHQQFLKDIKLNNINMYKFHKWVLFFYERVSINCISWFGKDFKEFNGIVGANEEEWLSHDKPLNLLTPNCINGDALCSHFAFYSQRNFLDTTNILEEYINVFK